MPYFIPHPWLGGGQTLEVFEQDYLNQNSHVGYWGRPSSSIDWCERNYVMSDYVAEFWNTLSNLILIHLSCVGIYYALKYKMEPRFACMHAAGLLVGIGSGLFHGTLTHNGQQGDETPMIWATSSWLYCLYTMDPDFERRFPERRLFIRRFLLAACCIFTIAHYHLRLVVSFQILIGVLLVTAGGLLLPDVRRCNDRSAKKLGYGHVVLMLSAFGLWLIDQHGCDALYDLPLRIPNPQFHAWWHALTAAACYVGPTYVVYKRALLTHRRPIIAWRFGVPVVMYDDMGLPSALSKDKYPSSPAVEV